MRPERSVARPCTWAGQLSDPEALPCTLDVDELIEQSIKVTGETLTFTGVSVGNPHCVVFPSSRWKVEPR